MTSVVQFPEMTSPSARVAAEIRAEMARKKVSQVTIARALGIAQPAVSRRVNGQVPLDANELATIAGILRISVGQLFGESVSSSPLPPTGGEWAPRGSNPQPTDYKSAHSSNVVPLRRPVRAASNDEQRSA